MIRRFSFSSSSPFLFCVSSTCRFTSQKPTNPKIQESQKQRRYRLNRVDTYGNKFVISTYNTKEEAEKEFKRMMEVPHKQGYDIEEVEN
jgi:hypothetical protein